MEIEIVDEAGGSTEELPLQSISSLVSKKRRWGTGNN